MAVGAQYGFSGLNQSLNTSGLDTTALFQLIQTLDLKLTPARVVDVVMDETHPEFKNLGEWNGLGSIKYELIDSPESKSTPKSVARPLTSNQKTIPLKNEIVLLFSLPNTTSLNELNGEKIYYYLSTLSLWNHPHHNAFPNVLQDSDISDAQSKDYQDIEGGNVRRVEDGSTEINLNSTKDSGGKFEEKINIHPLLPFTGDHIVEGRFGNSIRLGSTIKSKSLYQNTWSKSGDIGDPITIIRNGQPIDSSEEGWLPIVENINKDLSSMYFTSTQKIPIEVASKNYTGIRDQFKPTYPASYSSPQVILSSGRLLFNASSDSILLSAKKTISISAIEDIGISSRANVSLTGDEIRLGSNSASESLMLGDAFIKQFKVLLDSLTLLCDALVTEPTLKSTPLVATGLNNVIKAMNNQTDNFLSKISKTL